MIRCLAVCVLLASLALAQSTTTPAPSAPKPQSQGPAASNAPATPASQPADDSSALPPDAIVMTFPGLCDYDVSHKFTDPQCKTVVTRAQFDAIVQILHPASTPAGRRIVAGMYTEKLLQTQKALALGLEIGYRQGNRRLLSQPFRGVSLRQCGPHFFAPLSSG
jgi:hypothetical protein